MRIILVPCAGLTSCCSPTSSEKSPLHWFSCCGTPVTEGAGSLSKLSRKSEVTFSVQRPPGPKPNNTDAPNRPNTTPAVIAVSGRHASQRVLMRGAVLCVGAGSRSSTMPSSRRRLINACSSTMSRAMIGRASGMSRSNMLSSARAEVSCVSRTACRRRSKRCSSVRWDGEGSSRFMRKVGFGVGCNRKAVRGGGGGSSSPRSRSAA